MILTTTNSVEDYKVIEYIGVVSANAVSPQSSKSTFGDEKYCVALSETISQAQEKAFAQLKLNAERLNANAVIGINVDVQFTANYYVTILVTGTAVSILKRVNQ
ncbi:MAG TPA: hypothetical protein DDZ41_07395 [Flavobacterium sp.]|nr:hypothetical protein [Flavobacterium sp.]